MESIIRRQLIGTPAPASTVMVAIIRPTHRTSHRMKIANVFVAVWRRLLFPECRTSNTMLEYTNAMQAYQRDQL